MIGLLIKIRTARDLGLFSIARAISYRVSVRLGINPVRRLRAIVPIGPFFQPPQSPAPNLPTGPKWDDVALLFGRWPLQLRTNPPDWLANPINGQKIPNPQRNWWQIPDFDPIVGDIKPIWELSRFDWVLTLAQRSANADMQALERLNTWITDWCANNPPYLGPNWKCGQEASIRVLHLATAALLLDQVKNPTVGLSNLLLLHLQRIAPTIQYAIAQDNNHGTSEAAALFIGGSWLARIGISKGIKWEQTGRYWLENRAIKLIGEQGTFSQYSLNYHRVMLDTFSIVEVWRRLLTLPEFSNAHNAKLTAATQWLYHMVNPDSGDGPNVGANDGARLLPLTDTSYRDYRPSVQLAAALFIGKRAYTAPGSWDLPLLWLNVALPTQALPAPKNYIANDGGFAILRHGDNMALLRYPRFRFRPSQADALHVDFWIGNNNLLRDAGTYSYNSSIEWMKYFNGTASHNTVQFDEREQMPRISRFLFGAWLKTSQLEPLEDTATAKRFGAGYQDIYKNKHLRRITLSAASLVIEDEVSGFHNQAVLRWRLYPYVWKLKKVNDNSYILDNNTSITIKISANTSDTRCELSEGWESLYYLEKTAIPIVVITIFSPCKLVTTIDIDTH